MGRANPFFPIRMKVSALKVTINKLPRLQVGADDCNDDYCEHSPYSAGPIMIVPNLYLGSNRTATDHSALRELGIQCVINVAKEVASCPSPEGSKMSQFGYKYCQDHYISKPMVTSQFVHLESQQAVKRFKFDWAHNEDLLPVINEPIELLNHYLKHNIPVLVHCLQGVSRSPALIIGYLMKTNRIPLAEAYEYVKSKSPSISPNVSLISHLVQCEKVWK